MCDKDTLEDIAEFRRRFGHVTRRRFGQLSVAAGAAMLFPRIAKAADVTGSDVNVATPDGTADCYFVHPTSGRHPGVLIWPDVFGLRPAFKMMATRLAESGYSVLVVNPYYRDREAPILPEGASFDDPETRKVVMPLMKSFTPETQRTDARAFTDFLAEQGSVDTDRPMGTTGYCMGGPFVFRTAAELPERIGAAATFHGAGLVTEEEDSPHRLIPETDARFLVAIAESDHKRQPEARDTLREGFQEAGLKAEVEVYDGTMHGWCPPDSDVYDEAAAEKAWDRLLATFDSALT